MSKKRLFAVYLGGKAKGATLELHDIAFAAGKRIEDTIPQLRATWFGTASSLHIDSWLELKNVDGHVVSLSKKPAAPLEPKLFFVNIGSYAKGKFGENHHFYFLAAQSSAEAKKRARAMLATKKELLVHADNLLEIDSIIRIGKVSGLHVALKKPKRKARSSSVTNLYWPIAR